MEHGYCFVSESSSGFAFQCVSSGQIHDSASCHDRALILELHDLRRRIVVWFSFRFLVIGQLHHSILQVRSAWKDSRLLKVR